VVAAAASEIRAGMSVSLNWGLEKVHEPAVGRCRFEHKVVDLGRQMGSAIYSWDDEVRLNTQSGSQWDGLRHWGHTETGLYYNGTRHEDLIASPHLGMDHIDGRGGIVGRGVLLDYVAYAARHGIQYTPMSKHEITLADLKAMAAEEKVEFRAGDILIVRTGWIKWYEEHGAEEREAKIAKGNAWIGVYGCEVTAEWLWDNHFAAVAGDSIGWECWPTKKGWCEYFVSPLVKAGLTSVWQVCMITCWHSGECLLASCGTWKPWQLSARSSKDGVSF
jgi:hypothetical protein